jgi:pimeloyl-ACP methyl ester carboxylesterase
MRLGMPSAEQLQVRLHDSASPQTLVYLPGLHGDWTLISGFRKALHRRVRFAEVTYPRTTAWSLEDYARAVEEALLGHAIERAWLLGESFGSQVAWPIVGHGRFGVQGVILAGGFGRHPFPWGARLIENTFCRLPPPVLRQTLLGYARLARLRFRKNPEVCSSIQEFVARRTGEDLCAIRDRLRLVAGNDPCALARATNVPVYGLTGWLDPIVPWLWARGWLRRNCPSLKAYKILPADHNVLSTAPQASAEQVMEWIESG